MNPKVAAMAGRVGFDAAAYTWFDFTGLDQDAASDELQAVAEQHGLTNSKMYLDEVYAPSDSMAIIQPSLPEAVFTYDRHINLGGYEGAAIMMWLPTDDPHPYALVTERPIQSKNNGDFSNPNNSYTIIHKKLMKISMDGGQTEEGAINLYEEFCMIAVNLAVLINLRAHTTEQVVTAHIAKGLEFINRKRRSKGQSMLYSWNTIELKPQVQVKQLTSTGTHASPARHKRRAHMRRLRSGGFTWIPEMWVGKIENGLIVHDYVADRDLTKEKNT